MITNPEQAIALVSEALLRDLGDDVDIIFRFGSTTKGTTHRYSDVDLAYVPAGPSVSGSITVLVQETLLDLFPLPWSRLESWAEFDDMRGTVILEGELLFARDEAAAIRWQGLADRMRALMSPAARPEMVAKALTIFQRTGYHFYLVGEQAAAGNQLATLFHAKAIRDTVAHCVAVVNQTAADTRKLPQLLALARQPDAFGPNLRRLQSATDPAELLAASESLLRTTRAWLLAEQRVVQGRPSSFPAVFGSVYPELKADLQHIMLAAEEEHAAGLDIMSFYHELMIHIGWATTGIGYGSFNSLADYEQDLVALGFPALLPFVEQGDFAGLRVACEHFDTRLQAYLVERGVALNQFDSLEALAAHLDRSDDAPGT